MEIDIAGQVVVVTGAAQGIGRTLALGLAAEGARVAGVGHLPVQRRGQSPFRNRHHGAPTGHPLARPRPRADRQPLWANHNATVTERSTFASASVRVLPGTSVFGLLVGLAHWTATTG
jgi:NAD(P)-dependent dehydrogenase (short-subunit alcohol dehydrogenase family)